MITVRSVLKEINSTGAVHLILDCDVDHTLDILRGARDLQLLSEHHSYILTNVDSHTLDWSEFKNIRSNITTLRLFNTSGPIVTAAQVFNQILNYPVPDKLGNDMREEMDKLRSTNSYSKIKPNKVKDQDTTWDGHAGVRTTHSLSISQIPKGRNKGYPYKSLDPAALTPQETKTALLYDALNLFITTFSEEDSKEELILRPLSCEKSETSWHGIRFAEALRKLCSENSKVIEQNKAEMNNFYYVLHSKTLVSYADEIVCYKQNLTRGLLFEPLVGPINHYDTSGQRMNFELEIIELKNAAFRTTATWNSENPDKLNPIITSKMREEELKETLQHKTFRVVSRWAPNPNKAVLSGNDRFEGYAMDLMHEICKPENINCSYNFELVPDGNYGKQDPKNQEMGWAHQRVVRI
ncbi:hypothetical protein NQ317_015067 [Molorchus minor]|uniref:Ionotropic glutamate receptor L-glutamate and glycine-binding domain-containing protein n=1 Tax=Molorchus minor TaxID=1323400 RepID=A0ABQ9IRD5_9CUCU|nr:hypothetical protein NQ317_015067 [Molorchus minor]